MLDLIFFDKEGYSLNFAYNEIDELYEGKLLFDENSTDTFKTIVLNMFEYVKSFKYQDNNNIDLEKFQLFNEHGLIYKKGEYTNQEITNIEKVNSDSTFFSKWVYGNDFHIKFPIGTEVYFHDMAIPDFIGAGPNVQSFTVVSNKQNAFMIITNTDNNTYADPFVSGNVSSLNSIEIINYDNLDTWNEPGFEANIFENRKLTIVNSNKNEKVITIDKILNTKNIDIFSVDEASLVAYPFLNTNSLNVKVELKTDRIFLYSGNLNFSNDYNRIEFLSSNVPELLKPDTDFIFDTGILNSNTTITVSDQILPTWKNTVSYLIDDLIIFEDTYYRATAPTTGDIPSTLINWEVYDINWSETYTYELNYPVKYGTNLYFSTTAGNIGNLPTDTAWSTDRNYVIVEQDLVDELAVTGIANLTTSTLIFNQEFVENEKNTLISFYNNYRQNFLNLNIDLYFENNTLFFRNLYSENSVNIIIDVNDSVNTAWNRFVTYNIGDRVRYRDKTYESTAAANIGNFPNTLTNWTVVSDITITNTVNTYLLNTTESIENDRELINGNYLLPNQKSVFYNNTLKFLNIDSFGLNLTINGIEYNTPFDTDVTNTITDWIASHSANLANVGIIVTNTVDEILFESSYPNVPISIVPNLGSLANYYFKLYDIDIIAPEMTVLSITINNVEYSTDFNTDNLTTVTDWVNKYQYILEDLGIYVSNTGTVLNFGAFEEDLQLEYFIQFNKSYIDIADSYTVINYKLGNAGTIISSNKINYTGADDLQTLGFATAQVMSINNSDFYLNNQDYIVLFLDPTEMILSYQGPFFNDNTSIIELTTRDFIRKPRFGFDNDPVTKIRYKWKDDQTPEMFFYDYTGLQLHTGNDLSYTGIKPLIDITTDNDNKLYLQNYDNNRIEFVNDPFKQRTVFDEINYDLDKIDSEDDVTIEPEPYQVFIGYNDKIERSINSTLELYFVEDIELSISTDGNVPVDSITIIDNQIQLTSPTLNFNSFRKGQLITIKGKDNTNINNQSIWQNNGRTFKIKEVFDKIIVIDEDFSTIVEESTIRTVKSSLAPFNDIPTGMDITIKVMEKQILRCELYGQSEEEDQRYNTRLNNYGHNITPKEAYIFKEYDIQEKGIDWTFLNRKRKELLMNEREIFNHVTAYKSLINAIKFFGYSDLELYEYYRNINREDSNFNKLHKVEIPNIFENDFTELDPLFNTLPNMNYMKTKLLNLTYRITDFEGNSVQAYSLDEVITKLSGLKSWLKRNVLAINTEILDITGRTDVLNSNYLTHSTDQIHGFKSHDEVYAVKIDAEGYKQPISSGSSLYNINLKFSTLDNFNPDYFNLEIVTYKSYKNWLPTSNYSIGDKVVYLGLLYEALTNNSSKAPNTNMDDWTVTNLETVQTIREFKTDLLDYNFTVDKDVDSFITIKTVVENGYGGAVTFNKNISLDLIYLLNNIVFDNTENPGFDTGFETGAFG